MGFSTGNASFDNLMRRARSRRLTKDAVSDTTIDVQSSEEKQNENNNDNVKTESQLMDELSGLGVKATTTGTIFSSSSPLATAMIDEANVLDFGASDKSLGQRGMDIAADQQTFKDPIAEAFSNIGGREALTSGMGLATYGSLKAGQTELAKGLFTGTQMLSGMGGMALNVIGPTQKDPLGYNTAMGSGAFRATSDKVMGIHYDTAAKITQGIAGYEQGRIGGQTISMTPGLFGIGSVFSGKIPSGLTAGMFSDMMQEARDTRDLLDEEGGAAGGTLTDLSNFTNPQAAMEKGGIGLDAFSSNTAAAQAGIGYSSYDAQGNPTGAAPSGSQYSSTGTFSTGDSNDSNDSGGYGSSQGSMGGMGDYKKGGRIGINMGDRPGETMGGMPPQQPSMQPEQTEVVADMGFVDFDPNAPEAETVNDKYPKEARKDDFVINAPAVEFAGKQDVTKMIVDAVKSLREKGIEVVMGDPKVPLKEQAQIIVSQNEAMIPKVVAEEIGYDRLRKINNRGKKEVDRRKEEAELTEEEKPQAQMASKGGFIGMADGDIVERGINDMTTVKSPDSEISDLEDRINALNSEVNEIATARDKNLNSNPQTPFSKYASKEDPNPTKLQRYTSGVEFGDIEQGMDLLNQTSWNKLLQAGLRDERSLSDFVNQLKKGKGFTGGMGHASGYYDLLKDKIALDGRGDNYLSKSLMAHELMHKGAETLGKDPNYSFELPSANSSSMKFENLEDKPENPEGKAEHRYIQAVVNQAFLNSMITDGVNYKTKMKKDIVSAMVKEGILGKDEDFSDKEQDIQKYGNSVLTKEIERVFNYYMTPQNRSDFEEKIKNEMGLENIVSVVSGEDKKYYQIDPSLAGVLDPSEIKTMFQISNDVMAQDFETMLFKKQQYKAADRSSKTFKDKPELAKGGFISMANGGSVGEVDYRNPVTPNEDYGDFSSFSEYNNDQGGMNIIEQMNPNTIKKIKGIIKRGPKRGSISALIDSLPDREALALTIFAESVVSEDSPDAMRAIGETVLNRVDDKTYSFKNLNTLKDVLKGRSNKGEGSKMFSYEGLEPSKLTPRLSEMLNNKYWQKALTAADMAMDRSPDREKFRLRDDIFTYAKIGEASDRLKSNKRNEYFTTVGQHDFYSRTPEKGGRISSETMGKPDSFYR